MKFSDGFDARRLRPRGRRSWWLRLSALLALLSILLGTVLALAGLASWVHQPDTLSTLNDSPAATAIAIIGGGAFLVFGLVLGNYCRKSLRHRSDLSMAPHLMKKRD